MAVAFAIAPSMLYPPSAMTIAPALARRESRAHVAMSVRMVTIIFLALGASRAVAVILGACLPSVTRTQASALVRRMSWV